MEERAARSDRERWTAAISHLSIFAYWFSFPAFLIPLIIWLIERQDHPWSANQALQALLFQLLSFLAFIALLVVWALVIVVLVVSIIGIALLPAVLIFLVPALLAYVLAVYVYAVYAAVQVLDGKDFSYWLVGNLTAPERQP